MMNTSEVAIRCGEHAFTRLQKLLPQQDRLLPKIYQTEDDQYIIYWDSIHWFESSDKREAELVRAFNRAFDYLEECPFDQDGNILPNPVRPDISVMDILDYTKDLPDGFYQSDLQILHPPYPGINDIHYSNHMWKGDSRSISADIQEMPWEKGMHAVNQAMMRGYAAMPKVAYQAVVVGDIRQKGIFRSMLTNLTLPGEQVQVLIKKQHNTSSGRKYYANHKFFFIEHEYVVITKKPSGYEIAFVVPQHHVMDIRDSKCATWKDVVYAVLQQLGASASLDKIYEEIEPHKKTQGNPHWKAKVRQTLQMLAKTGSATHVAYGKWCVA